MRFQDDLAQAANLRFSWLYEAAFKYILLAIFLLCSAAAFAVKGTWLTEYTLGEWLINYEAGFVRRGLAGSITLLFSRLTELSPSLILDIFISLLFALNLLLVAAFSVRLTKTQVFWLLFSPALFLMIPMDVINRKENIFYLLIIFHAWLFIKESNFLDVFEQYILPIFGVFCTLTHELYLFFLPFHYVILFFRRGAANSRSIFYNLLPLVAFAIAIVFRGDAAQRTLMCERLMDFSMPCKGGLWAIGMSGRRSIESSIGVIADAYSLQSYWVVYALTNLVTLFIFRKQAVHLLGVGRAKIAFIAGNMLFPIVVLAGWDIGRWVALYSIHNFFVLAALTRIGGSYPRLSEGAAMRDVGTGFLVVTLSLFLNNPGCCGFNHDKESMTSSKIPIFFANGANFLLNGAGFVRH